MSNVNRKNEALLEEPEWHESIDPSMTSRLHLLITKDAEGTYSAVVLNLPGAGSCGDTEEEAVANAMDATRGVLEVYESNNDEVPWMDTSSLALNLPVDAKLKWVTLDA